MTAVSLAPAIESFSTSRDNPIYNANATSKSQASVEDHVQLSSSASQSASGQKAQVPESNTDYRSMVEQLVQAAAAGDVRALSWLTIA